MSVQISLLDPHIERIYLNYMNNSILQRPFPYRQYNVTLILIGINVLVFLITSLAPRAQLYLAMNPTLVIRGNAWWQLVTYMFAHANISHILFNMIGLFFFGVQIERRVGSTEFLVFYLVTGILAGVFSLLVYWFSGSQQVFLLGASGAVFAVLLAFATFFPRSMIYLFGILPIRAPILVLGYTAIEIVSGFMGRSGVAHLTHLAGFGFAYIYMLIRYRINPIQVFLEDYR